MTSTWWRMSRWAVGSSRTRIGAVCATATATNTSCRSPSDSARASRSAGDRRRPARSPHRWRSRRRPARTPLERRFVRQPPERDDLLDRHRERQLGELGDDRDRRARRALRPTDSSAAPDSRTDPLARRERPGHHAQQGRLAGAVRSDQGDPLAGAERQVDVRRATAPRRRTRRETPDSDRIGSAVTARIPSPRPIQQDEEERRAEDGHHDPDRDVADHPGDEVGGGQQVAPTRTESGMTRRAAGPDDAAARRGARRDRRTRSAR